MEKSKVIAYKNFPARLPVISTLAVFMALDLYNAPQWLCGAFGVLGIVWWIVCIYSMTRQNQIDVLKNGEEN